jgi:hypothetical protein
MRSLLESAIVRGTLGRGQLPIEGLSTIPAPVAQGIEHRFPKPCVARSNRAGGATFDPVGHGVRYSKRWTQRSCEAQMRHSARLDPRGTRIGSRQPGGVREKRTGGASMWTSPSGLGAS